MHKILSLGALKCSPSTFNIIFIDVCVILLIVAAVANVPPQSKCTLLHCAKKASWYVTPTDGIPDYFSGKCV
jgi:hypothetical protein